MSAGKDGEFVSRTRKKREVEALQELGAGLVDLPPAQLDAMALPGPLDAAVREAQRIRSREARRRQIQYIGKIMRSVDPAPIRAALDGWRAETGHFVAEHKRAEAWRERLLADESALVELAAEYPAADVASLHSLIQAAARERAAGQPPRSYRQLYQALRALIGQ